MQGRRWQLRDRAARSHSAITLRSRAAPKSRADRGLVPCSRFRFRDSSVADDRAPTASTTRFRIVVCGCSTSPKRMIAPTATMRSHRTRRVYRYVRAQVGYRWLPKPATGGCSLSDRSRSSSYVLKQPVAQGRGSGVSIVPETRAKYTRWEKLWIRNEIPLF